MSDADIDALIMGGGSKVAQPVQQKQAPVASAASDNNPQTPGSAAYWARMQGPSSSGRTTAGEEIGKAVGSAIDYATGQVNAIPAQIRQDYAAGRALAQSGVSDLQNGKYLPTFPSSDPHTWTGGGILKTAGGGLGAVFSPLSGSVNKLIEEPATEATGKIGRAHV